jgi:hypothetical protein
LKKERTGGKYGRFDIGVDGKTVLKLAINVFRRISTVYGLGCGPR